MNNEIPKTKSECFAVLDSMLSEEEKKELIVDEWSSHFGIGMWIRNNWIYQHSREEVGALMNLFTKNKSESHFILFDPDNLSSDIIHYYVKYLKKKYPHLKQ